MLVTPTPDVPRHASVGFLLLLFKFLSKHLITRFIDFVNKNPSEFADAYFDIASIRIYQ